MVIDRTCQHTAVFADRDYGPITRPIFTGISTSPKNPSIRVSRPMVPQELGDLLPQRPLIPHGGSAALGDSRELSGACIYKEHSSHGQSHSFSILIIISIESTCIEAIEPSTSHHINRAAIASKQHVCYQTHIPHLPRSITAGPLLSQQRLPHSEIERAQCCIAIAISTLSKPGMSMRSSQMLQAQLTNPF